jgi:agmatinase
MDRCFFAQDMDHTGSWMEKSIEKMTDHVYISLDLDVFDPSIFPATGTPEPGGMLWYQVLEYLRKVIEIKRIVGFDLVEFAPIDGLTAPGFLMAKLYYKLLSYIFLRKDEIK